VIELRRQLRARERSERGADADAAAADEDEKKLVAQEDVQLEVLNKVKHSGFCRDSHRTLARQPHASHAEFCAPLRLGCSLRSCCEPPRLLGAKIDASAARCCCRGEGYERRGGGGGGVKGFCVVLCNFDGWGGISLKGWGSASLEPTVTCAAGETGARSGVFAEYYDGRRGVEASRRAVAGFNAALYADCQPAAAAAAAAAVIIAPSHNIFFLELVAPLVLCLLSLPL
jgi:hypothetical protein